MRAEFREEGAGREIVIRPRSERARERDKGPTAESGPRVMRGRRRRQARKQPGRTRCREELVPGPVIRSLPVGAGPELRASFYVRWKMIFPGSQEDTRERGCGSV